MNFQLFIAKRLLFDNGRKKNISYSISKIATFSIALSIAVMVIAVAVVMGFKYEIRNKIIGFGSHIQIVNFESNVSFETHFPISTNQEFYPSLTEIDGIKHIQIYAQKPGIIKTKNKDIQAVALKGVSTDFDWSFFQKNLVEGNILQLSDSTLTNQAIISKKTASSLKLSLNDKFIVYFPQDEKSRPRPFKICGIYETGMEEYDNRFVITDIKQIQKVNSWPKDQITGFEILIDNFSNLDQLTYKVKENADFIILPDQPKLRTLNIKELYPHIFGWLDLQNKNVFFLLFFTIFIATLNMVTSLLILILDRINMIGLLKSQGATNKDIEKIFLYQSGYLILKGLIIGNLIGIGLSILQKHFSIIKLDQSSYWLSTVPIKLDIEYLLLLNGITFLIIILCLLIPSIIISNISPSKTIKFN